MEQFIAIWKENIFWLTVLCGCLPFCWRLPRRRYFPAKFLLGLAVQAAFAMSWAEYVEKAFSRNALLESTPYVIHIFLFTLMIRWCYECDMVGAAFCAMCGYCLQHIASRIHLVFWMAVGSRWEWLRDPSVYLFFAGTYVAGYQAFKKRSGGVMNIIRVDAVGQLIISAIALFAMNIVEMIQFLYQPAAKDPLVNMSGPIMAVLFTCITLMLEYNLLSYKTAETERNTLKEIVQEKRNQTEFEKKMMETVNMNAHDLKYKVKDGALLQDAQRDIERAVDAYDTALHTGNEALDIILSKKKLDCFRRGIQLICIADGKRLDFMSESDIFTLFGNILDNAIEGVERLDDPDDRIIQLNVVGRNSFVQIREENYFRDGLLLSGQTLMTTKEDKEHHGYGMKSIALLVEKYGGHHKIETQENLFALDILLPMRDRQNGER